MFRLLLLSYFLFGCTNSSYDVQYSDTQALGLRTIHWDSSDLHEMAEAMVSAILKDGKVADRDNQRVYGFLPIKNNTYDHIDTQDLTNTIKTSLIHSKLIKIVDVTHREKLHKILQNQIKNAKYYDQIKKSGKEMGVEGFFYGSISAIYQKNSIRKDMYFKFTLNLINIEKGEIIWSEEMDIRKVYDRKLFGW